MQKRVVNVTLKNRGLRKFWQDLEILKVFLISRKVSFLHGLFLLFFKSRNFSRRSLGLRFLTRVSVSWQVSDFIINFGTPNISVAFQTSKLYLLTSEKYEPPHTLLTSVNRCHISLAPRSSCSRERFFLDSQKVIGFAWLCCMIGVKQESHILASSKALLLHLLLH